MMTREEAIANDPIGYMRAVQNATWAAYMASAEAEARRQAVAAADKPNAGYVDLKRGADGVYRMPE